MDIRDDGFVFVQQGIEQGALAYVCFSDDSYGNALLNGISRLEGVGEGGDAVVNSLCEF